MMVQPHEQDRPVRLRRVVSETARRRAARESVSDQQVMSAHPDLLPELQHELRKLRLIESARAEAERCPSGGSSAIPERGTLGSEAMAPTFVNGYELFEEIHRGSQGIVYRAVQRSTGRPVALKVLRGGTLAGERDLARFDREVCILAKLQHPNIVGVLDRGAIDDRRYVVLEYAPGVRLDQYVNSISRAIEPTLRLFELLASAVHAAHLRGVIHRDLKPDNVLVDKEGQPHVLDFGLARLYEPEDPSSAAAHTITEPGQFIGSPSWTSPEQAAGRLEATDVRSDVYCLGVMLFHALTGHFPYAVTGRVPEVLDRILHATPRRPRAIRREISRDLEVVLLKSLAKEPERRYQSAGDFRGDLRRCLAGEPIDARRDSSWYTLSRAIRRHWLASASVAALLLAISGASIAFWSLYRQATAREQALLREQERSRTSAQWVAQLRRILLESLVAPTAEVSTVADRITEMEKQIRSNLDGIRKLLPVGAPELADALLDLGEVVGNLMADWAAAEPYLREALQIRESAFGNADPRTAAAQVALAGSLLGTERRPDAEPLLRQALAAQRAQLDPDSAVLADTLRVLAWCRYLLDDRDEAVRFFAEALSLLPDAPVNNVQRILTLKQFGRVLHKRGEHARSRHLSGSPCIM